MIPTNCTHRPLNSKVLGTNALDTQILYRGEISGVVDGNSTSSIQTQGLAEGAGDLYTKVF